MESLAPNALLKPVGRVKDAHSLKGELFVRLFAGKADWLENFKTAYLVSPDATEVRELEVLSAKPHKDGLIVKIKGLEDRTPAEMLKGYGLEIDSELLVSEPGEDIYLDEIMGFELLDLTTEIRTKIHGVDSNTVQDLLLVNYEGNEYMVPFVKPLIEKVDFENRLITMRLPLGIFGFSDDEKA
jgi:16S rRNA processing protein RimM